MSYGISDDLVAAEVENHKKHLRILKLEADLKRITKANKANGDCAEERAVKLDAVQEVCRETSDDYAPDRPPYDVTDLIERIEKAMEGE